MLKENEKHLIYNEYFEVWDETERDIVFKSVNTGHCWIIEFPYFKSVNPYRIKHMHDETMDYYHKHAKARTIESAIKKIKKHDEYVLKERKYH